MSDKKIRVPLTEGQQKIADKLAAMTPKNANPDRFLGLVYYENRVAELEQEIDRLKRWIPVSERLPEAEGYYIVYTPDFNWGKPENPCYITTAWMDTDKVFRCGVADVVKWMPLPPIPEEE